MNKGYHSIVLDFFYSTRLLLHKLYIDKHLYFDIDIQVSPQSRLRSQ
jgi:hypothetical protein